MTAIVRFAPSPTGHIHIGNVRTALFNWLFAQKAGGNFILRFDDTDVERSRLEYAEAIERDLAWLGVTPTRIERQSARVARYEEASETLKRAGLLYPCYETPEELDRRRKRHRARGLPPVYDRSALKLSDEERAAFEAEGRRPHWRFLLPNFDTDPFIPVKTDVRWDDLCRGSQSVDLASLSDPVLVRGDGSYLYTLPSILDDIDMGVSHVIRGEDHVANTGVQIAIFKALEATPPTFAHHNLLTTSSGEGLSKRSGALSVASLREAGYEPMTVVSLAVLIGTSEAVEPVADMAELAVRFDLSKVSRSPAAFDPADLDGLNAKLLHHTDYAHVRERLLASGFLGGEDRLCAFWQAVCGNISKFDEIADWWRVVEGPVMPVVDAEDADLIAAAHELLPEEPWDETTWKAWTNAVKDATGRKGRGLFMPLRKALTGLEHGPELARLLPLIGRRDSLARLS